MRVYNLIYPPLSLLGMETVTHELDEVEQKLGAVPEDHVESCELSSCRNCGDVVGTGRAWHLNDSICERCEEFAKDYAKNGC